jgi:NTE family protein
MNLKRVAIACQGGGSQCSFVAGALETLLARGIQDRFQIVGLSGTSGGAITAAVAWNGLLLRERGDRSSIPERIVACWKDLSAQTPREVFLDQFCTQLVRLAENGFISTIARSPSSLQFRLWSQAASSSPRIRTQAGQVATTSIRACRRGFRARSRAAPVHRWDGPTYGSMSQKTKLRRRA